LPRWSAALELGVPVTVTAVMMTINYLDCPRWLGGR